MSKDKPKIKNYLNIVANLANNARIYNIFAPFNVIFSFWHLEKGGVKILF